MKIVMLASVIPFAVMAALLLPIGRIEFAARIVKSVLTRYQLAPRGLGVVHGYTSFNEAMSAS
jgi:hypothetical protein